MYDQYIDSNVKLFSKIIVCTGVFFLSGSSFSSSLLAFLMSRIFLQADYLLTSDLVKDCLVMDILGKVSSLV